MNKNIGVLGCGWLGMPLGQSLAKKGYFIKGSTTSRNKLEEIHNKGITPFLIDLQENQIHGDLEGFLSQLDVLIINIPPNLRKQPKSNYVDKMRQVLKVCNEIPPSHIFFVSSTSVYGDAEGEITEKTLPEPITNSGKQLLASEQLFQQSNRWSTTIIRFGGLIGGNRHPVNQLSGRELKNGDELVNLIHRKDCIHMIETIIENNYWNEVFNGVYPYHPTKSEYYTSEALKKGITPPLYINSSNKIRKKKVILRNFFVKKHVLTTSISS